MPAFVDVLSTLKACDAARQMGRSTLGRDKLRGASSSLRRSGGELQWTAPLYTNSSRKSAAPRPRSPKPSKGSHHLRLNWPSRTGEPNPMSNPLSRFGRPLQNAAARDGCQPADQAVRPFKAAGLSPDRRPRAPGFPSGAVPVSRITYFERQVIALFHGLPAGISRAL
jgi:hypothetical protein